MFIIGGKNNIMKIQRYYYKKLFDEIAKSKYKTYTVRDFYFRNSKSQEKVNVILRIDGDAGFLPALQGEGKINESNLFVD